MKNTFSGQLAAKSFELENELRTHSTISGQKTSISDILQSGEITVIVRLFQRLIKKNRSINSGVKKFNHFPHPKKEIRNRIDDDKLIPLIADHIFEHSNDLNEFLWAFHGVTWSNYLGKNGVEGLKLKIDLLLENKKNEIIGLTKPVNKQEFTKYDKYLDNCAVALYRGYKVMPGGAFNQNFESRITTIQDIRNLFN